AWAAFSQDATLKHLQLCRPLAAGIPLDLLARLHFPALACRTASRRVAAYAVPVAPTSYACGSCLSAPRGCPPGVPAPNRCTPGSTRWHARRLSSLVTAKSLGGCIVPMPPVQFKGRPQIGGMRKLHVYAAVLPVSGFIFGIVPKNVLIA